MPKLLNLSAQKFLAFFTAAAISTTALLPQSSAHQPLPEKNSVATAAVEQDTTALNAIDILTERRYLLRKKRLESEQRSAELHISKL